MCEGEYESLKAIYAVLPWFVPQPYAWGKIEGSEETFSYLRHFEI
jgi:protein-ribulosamine 3-kinase